MIANSSNISDHAYSYADYGTICHNQKHKKSRPWWRKSYTAGVVLANTAQNYATWILTVHFWQVWTGFKAIRLTFLGPRTGKVLFMGVGYWGGKRTGYCNA